MKRILSIIMICASTSILAADCDTAIEEFGKAAFVKGVSTSMLQIRETESYNLNEYQKLLEENETAKEVAGYDRETIVEAIADNEISIANLNSAIVDSDKAIEAFRQMIKESCQLKQ